MYRWITKELVNKLSGLGRGVRVEGFGGDHDTNTIIVEYDMIRKFYIQGWDPENCLDDQQRDDVDVEMITCYDGQYQDTWYGGADSGMIQLYADILKVLKRETDGKSCGITHHWKEFF